MYSTLRFENLRSPKKRFFSCFRGHKFFLDLFYKKGIMQLFSEDTKVFSKKKKKYFDPENMKNCPHKLLIIGPLPFILSTGPAAQTDQKQKTCIPKSHLMQDWVFRLGYEFHLTIISQIKIQQSSI